MHPEKKYTLCVYNVPQTFCFTLQFTVALHYDMYVCMYESYVCMYAYESYVHDMHTCTLML